MTQPSDALLEKLEKLLEAGELVVFTREEALKLRVLAAAPPNSVLSAGEVSELRTMLTVSRGVEGLGYIMGFVRKLLFWIGLVVIWTLWIKGKISISDMAWFGK